MAELLSIMAKLRDPDEGCQWDIEQTFATIAPYTIEEAYEVADAIERGDMADLRDELGDLLLQVVFHSCIAQEAGVFSFEDVVCSINDKMIRRHPHVFGEHAYASLAAQVEGWEMTRMAEIHRLRNTVQTLRVQLHELAARHDPWIWLCVGAMAGIVATATLIAASGWMP